MSLTGGQQALLAAWDVGTVLSSAIPDTGAINQTLLVTTTRGDYALRAYRHRDREPVAREHAAIAHVRAQGLPAIAPLPLPDGATILERAGRYYALFPRAPGDQVRRVDLRAGEVVAMGTFLGRLHHALRSFPPAWAARRSFAGERAATLERIARLEAVIHARDGADPLDAIALRRLAGRRAWLARTPPPRGSTSRRWNSRSFTATTKRVTSSSPLVASARSSTGTRHISRRAPGK